MKESILVSKLANSSQDDQSST